MAITCNHYNIYRYRLRLASSLGFGPTPYITGARGTLWQKHGAARLEDWMPLLGNPCSYGHLPVITGCKWDYTFYKWGYKYL